MLIPEKLRRLLPLFIAVDTTIAAVIVWLILPLPASFDTLEERSNLRLLDRNGQLLYEVRPEDRGATEYLEIDQIPEHIIDTLIATEDRTFFSHHGVSIRGIARAVRRNVEAGGFIQGGSTITQQLVRAALQPERRTFPYKIREALLAVKTDMRWSKDGILERYLNAAYFGHQAYGIGAAARTYFGKSVEELSRGETALLIGLLQSPSALDPYQNPAGAKQRRLIVLDALLATGNITPEAAETAGSEPVQLHPDRVTIEAPHFVFWVLGSRGDLPEGETEVRTTLDLPLQQTVEEIITRNVGLLAEKNVTSAAVVVLDAVNGDILSMAGSADYFDDAHDGAVNVAVSSRQPGSALKPFTYALALARGATPATTVSDTEVQFFTEDGNPYIPRNYDFGEHGLVRYREALANSYNIAAVKVLERVGVSSLLSFLRSAGLGTLTADADHYGLALTLGAGEVRLLDLAAAYGIFPRGGRTLTPRALPEEQADAGTPILDTKVAWLVSDMLSDNAARMAEFGESSPLFFPDRPVAAKTGTTRNSRDNWVIGYTPERVVGVWVGNADNSPMKGTSGVTGAGPIFHEVMQAATRHLPPSPFERPAGITDRTVCRLSGKLPTPACPETIHEHFVAGTEPLEHDDIYRSVRIDRRNGLRAGDGCPDDDVTEKVFPVFPPDLRKWAREQGYPQAPDQHSPFCPGSENDNAPDPEHEGLTITRPRDGESFRLDPLIPNENERLIFEARAENVDRVSWFVDGAGIGEGTAPDYRIEWAPTEGWHTIEARHGEAADRLRIEVIR